MAFDSAIHFLDELKDKYIHEVEKAIDDWDYQDFSPDKRTPLLDNEISGDAATDLAPEPNALQQIKDASTLDWAGLSRDEMLANQAFGRMSISSTGSASYETRVVAMASPAGGVQGIPDADALQRFLHHATVMNPQALADALCTRLQQTTWQIRAKALVLMDMLLESPDLVGSYLPVLRAHNRLVQLVDSIRTQDHSVIARENARKVLSLIQSNGADPMLLAREHVATKPHVRHAPTIKKKADVAVTAKPKLSVQTKPASPTTKQTPTVQNHHFHSTSPKIAAAALASWRRRSQKELLAGSDETGPWSPVKENSGTVSHPPSAPVSPSSRTSSMMLQKAGSSRSGFTFVDQPNHQQPRVSITTSRTQSFR